MSGDPDRDAHRSDHSVRARRLVAVARMAHRPLQRRPRRVELHVRRVRAGAGLKAEHLPLLLIAEEVRRAHLPPQPLAILGERADLVDVDLEPEPRPPRRQRAGCR